MNWITITLLLLLLAVYWSTFKWFFSLQFFLLIPLGSAEREFRFQFPSDKKISIKIFIFNEIIWFFFLFFRFHLFPLLAICLHISFLIFFIFFAVIFKCHLGITMNLGVTNSCVSIQLLLLNVLYEREGVEDQTVK